MSITKKEPRTEWYNTGGKQDNVPPGLDISGGLDGAQFKTNDQISVYWRDAADTGLFGELTRQNVATGTKVDAVSPVITNNDYILAYYNEAAAEYQVTGILDTDPKAEYVVFNKNVTDSWTIGSYTGAVDVAIFRTTELTQDHEYRDGDKYYATNNEDVADKAMSAIQELDYDRDRSLKFDPAYEPNNPDDTTLPRPEADQFIKWNATGDALENAPSHTVRVSPNDTTPKTLREKIVDSASVQWNEINDGGDETLEAFAVNGAIDHDQLFNFELDEHVAHSDVNIIAGSSLTGGGNIASDVTLNVDQAALNHNLITGTGGLNHEDITIVGGDGLTGGGSIDAATITLDVDPSGEPLKSPAQDTDEILIDDGTVQKTTLFPSTLVAPAAIDTANDEMLFRDDSDGGRLKKAKVADIVGTATVDGDAIHDNVAAEINLIAAKATPVAADEFIIEDSAGAVYDKKKLTFGNLESNINYDNISNKPDYSDISANDVATDVTGAELETLTDGSNADALHVHAAAATPDYTAVSGADVATDVTGAELETLTDGSNADTLHDHTTAGITDLVQFAVDPVATDDSGSGYLVGSRWINTATDKEFVCLDNTAAAAVWTETTGAGGGTDADAIHDNVANEIAVVTEKVTPVAADLLLIEDSADSNNKKRVQIGNLPGGGGGGGSDSPAGTILPFGGTIAPSGYVFCDGTSYPVATYPDLHTAIGDAFGGDGGTNFNVPDLRGQFIRGVDNAHGDDPDSGSRTAQNTGGNTGDNVGSEQTDQFKSHTHSSPYVAGINTDRSSSQGGGSPGSTGASGGNETRPKNVYVNFIIKTVAAATPIVGATTFDYEVASGSTYPTIKDVIDLAPPAGTRIYVRTHDVVTVTQVVSIDGVYIEFAPNASIDQAGGTLAKGLSVTANRVTIINPRFESWDNVPATDRGLVLEAASKNCIVRGGRFDSASTGGYDDLGTNNSVDVILEVV